MLEGVVQVVCTYCDTDNEIPRDRLHESPTCVKCRAPLFEGRPASFDDEHRFRKHVRHNDIPVLVLFHAALTSANGDIRSAFNQAASQLEPDARLITIDVPALPDVADHLKVARYPTLLLLHHERELARHAGMMDLAQLLAWARPLVAAVTV